MKAGRRPLETAAPRLHAEHRASEFLTTREVCAYLRYSGRHQLRSLYKFIARTGLRVQRRSRTLLIRKRDLDAVIGAHAGQDAAALPRVSASV